MFTDGEDLKKTKELLNNLSAGASSAETASQRCRETLQNVQRLLDPSTLTQYQFRKRKPVMPLGREDLAVKMPPLDLSPFAQMVFKSTKDSFRYLTPESPETKPLADLLPESTEENAILTTPTGSKLMQPNGHTITPSSQHRQVQAVVVSNNLTLAERAQYQYVPVGSSHDRGFPSSSRNTNISHQQKGDQAAQALKDLLSEVFRAESRTESNGSGVLSELASRYFTSEQIDDEHVLTLQPSVLSLMESCMSKAATYGRLSEVEVDHLSQIQKFCERPVAALESLSLRIGDGWSDDDVQEWSLRVKTAETGLISARMSMHIMAGMSQTKELQSENYLRNILDGLKAVIEGFLLEVVQEPASLRERIRGEKDAPPANPKFAILVDHRKEVVALLNASNKSVRLLGDLLVKTDLDETSLSTVEYLCKMLIFAENATAERESAIGVKNFEGLRQRGMDVLAKVFTKYTGQRQFIFDEILISLEKLPATKQNARQFHLPNAKPIQLVSALLMRLVQTSATRTSAALKLSSKIEQEAEDDEDEDASGEEDSQYESDEDEIKVSPLKAANTDNGIASLIKPLYDATQINANYIVHVLIQRALSTSKSSEEPYRKLLDIFTEDFINCLGSPDWPAAEILLRALTARMIALVEKESSNVPSRTLALEFLGNMGSGVLELQIAARNAAHAVDTADLPARMLQTMFKQLESGNLDACEVLSFHGPYRIVLEFIQDRNVNDDAQLTTAKGCHLMQWAHATFNSREGSADSDSSEAAGTYKILQANIKRMLVDPHWFDESAEFENVPSAVGNLAAMIVTLNMPFCKAFNKMFSILLTSMSGENSTSTLKSRSLKSVVTLLEKDPGLLERNQFVLGHILRCAGDTSPLVRDSALGLIDKCMSLQPNLSEKFYKTVILRTNDGAVGVRKRAMKMLREIYLRNNSNPIRSAIANAILARIEDSEDSVIEIARTTMEEIWFHPLYSQKLTGDHAIKGKIAYTAHAALFIETVDRSDEVPKVLEMLMKRLLTKSKTVEANARVCKTLIEVLFNGIIDDDEIPGRPTQDAVLRSLTLFARSCPALFTPTQLERLEPYTENLNDSDDLDVYRSVVVILRHVLPHQNVINEAFLGRIHMSILKAITRLPKAELSEAVPCLWTLSQLIDDTDRVAHVLSQLLNQVASMRQMEITLEQNGLKLIKLVRIIGELGNACDFEKSYEDFTNKLKSLAGSTVPDMIVEATSPFTNQRYPRDIREVALEAVCSVAQAWPKMFLRKDMEAIFEIVFKEHDPKLEAVLLRGLEAFFVAQETPEEDEHAPALGSGTASGTERLSKTYVASDQDGATLFMAQRFIDQIINIAVSSFDEPAFVAARLVVSINKQGLVHPKNSVPALVALGTCPNKAVSAIAFKEHKTQHSKHESLYDKEYMRAVQRTFEYQTKVIVDAGGYFGSPPTAKLHLTWEVLKVGKAQVRKKFLSNLAQKLDFNSTTSLPQHLLFVRFCLENIALLDYDRTDDLLQLLAALEKVFSGTGSSIAQAIESEVLQIHVASLILPNGLSDAIQVQPQPPPVATDVNSTRLEQLAVSSQILTLIWETRSFLVKIWNMQKHMARSKQQKDKDTAKAPNRATNAPAITDVYLKRIAEISWPPDDDYMCQTVCKAFVELISVDNEVTVGTDEDTEEADLMNGYDTPSEGSKKSPSLPPSGSGKGRKRKLSNAGATPRKKGRPSLGGKRRSSGARYGESDDEEGGWD